MKNNFGDDKVLKDSSNFIFSGSMTALITPFLKNGEIDIDSFNNLVEWQINSGTDGLVPVGTTGESPSLSHEEHDIVIELCVKKSSGRIPILAGAGSNSTSEAIRLSKNAEKVGADGVLIVTPYYNKPTQEGLLKHFISIADNISIPIIIYDIPGRSIVRIDDVTLEKLFNHKNIIGIKDATAECARPTRLHNLIGSKFCQLSGEDATVLPYLASGGHGCISVVSNIAPKECSELHKAWSSENYLRAFELQKQLMPLHDALFCESSPGPVKYAAERLELCESYTRLPLCEISEISKQKVDRALKLSKII